MNAPRLDESLQQQTATADVLKVISRSSVDLETVLDTLVETVARLCRADQAVMFRRRDDKYHLVAACGLTEEAEDFVLTHPFAVDRGTISGRVVLGASGGPRSRCLAGPRIHLSGSDRRSPAIRTMLGIPLLREQTLIGIFPIYRTRVEPFTDKEIELATSFADQAVIAIENARLFEELHDRQAELARYLRQHGRWRRHVRRRSAAYRVEPQFPGDARSAGRLPRRAAELCRVFPLSR